VTRDGADASAAPLAISIAIGPLVSGDSERRDRQLRAASQHVHGTAESRAAQQGEPELRSQPRSDLLGFSQRDQANEHGPLPRLETQVWRRRLVDTLRRECRSGTHTVEFRQPIQ
jgi:hypothetical protein